MTTEHREQLERLIEKVYISSSTFRHKALMDMEKLVIDSIPALQSALDLDKENAELKAQITVMKAGFLAVYLHDRTAYTEQEPAIEAAWKITKETT